MATHVRDFFLKFLPVDTKHNTNNDDEEYVATESSTSGIFGHGDTPVAHADPSLRSDGSLEEKVPQSKEAAVVEDGPAPHVSYIPIEAITPDDQAQDGVRNAEAITLTWTRKSLICAYAL